MHEVIQHVGIVSRLDCWREEVSKQSQTRYKNLNEWAASKPTFEEIQHLARIIVRTYLPDEKSPAPQFRPDAQRDEKWENTQLRDKYFLLYEELTHAMNAGDIGHVETCFMPWVFIFKGCGKHKYAMQMMKFLHDLHFVYPPGLRRAIRMNILVNPTGRKNHFRAIDWVVEHNNLYTKRIYGGRFSNRTKARILKESVLIQVYKNVRISFEKMFALNHRTFKHSIPKMRQTFNKLGVYMMKMKTHEFVAGRKAHYRIPDVMKEGMHRIIATKGQGIESSGNEEVDETLDIEVDGADGDLDV